jgi:hypothetical protein
MINYRSLFVATALGLTSCSSKLPSLQISEELTAPHGSIIKTEAEALDFFANGGRIIFAGDIHQSSAGHKALAELMPTLARAHVTVYANAEFAPDLNPFFETLQNDIRTKNLSVHDISQKFQIKWAEEDIHPIGGVQALDEYAEIFIAATKQNIKFIAVDHREDNDDMVIKANEAVKS